MKLPIVGLHNGEVLDVFRWLRFEFRSGHRLSRLRFSCFSSVPIGKCYATTVYYQILSNSQVITLFHAV
jgi:hypothetical protein